MSAADLYTTVNALGFAGGREVFEVLSGDLVDDDLQELIAMSLFTWRRALPEDPVPDGASRQGWYGDETFGSRLWLLSLSPSGAALTDGRRYAEEALAWLVDEQIVGGFDIVAELAPDRRGVYLDVTVRRPLQPEARIRYAYLWR